MNIVFVTSEVAGIYKIGGLADVSQSLPKALGKLGHSVIVLLPRYREVDTYPSSRIGDISVQFAGRTESVTVYEMTTHDAGVRVIVLDHPLLKQYHSEKISEVFTFYSIVAASLCSDSQRYFGTPTDIVHCHDWHTGLVPVLLKSKKNIPGASDRTDREYIPTVFTIHNLMYTGNITAELLRTSIDGLHIYDAPCEYNFHEFVHGKKYISLLREGLEQSTVVSTVSPTYATEIAVNHPVPIEDVLIRRKSSFFGILNGIDMQIWDPMTDSNIQSNYGVQTVDIEKKKNKIYLQELSRLPTENSFVIGFVGRIEPRQKGIDLVMTILSKVILDKNIQIIILGTGEDKTEKSLLDIAAQFPRQIMFMNMFDDKIAHQIYAGSDALLVPSKFEPCGLTQLIAMRYGTLPIVRKTGGLADTVTDGVTGFAFSDYDPDQLMEKIYEAYSLWSHQSADWLGMVRTAMQCDFSWEQSAAAYVHMYKRAMTKR